MIKTKISIDLLNPGSKKVLYTVQGDEYSRGVDFAVYKNNVPYDELDSFSASFSFSKEDGTGGSYDQMPDGSVAYSISENIISVLIAPQVLTSPGFVDFSIKLTRNNEVLHTFSIKIFVQQNPGLSYISENYYKILGSLPDSGWQPNMYLGTDSRGNVVAKVDGGTGGDSGGGIVFFPSVDKYGNLSWSNNGGLENPETVNISGDPGERGLSMYLLNASLVGSAEYYSFSDFVIPEGYVPKLNDLVLYRSGHLGYIHEVNMELERALVSLIPGANLSGPSGEKGEKGDTGAQGEPGKDGADGAPGKDGQNGKDGTNGKDGVSATHSWNGTTLTITSASGTSSANLKGDQGIQGIQGEPGKDGEDGAPGKDGAKGADGKDGYSIFHTTEEATMDDWPFDPRFIKTNGRELQPGDKLLTPAGKLFSIYAVSGGIIDASFVSLLKGEDGVGVLGVEVKNDADTVIRFGFALTDGTIHEFPVNLPIGRDGVGISSVEQTTTSTEDGGDNVFTVTLTDGMVGTFTVKNGSRGSAGTKGDKGDKGDTGGTGATGSRGFSVLRITTAPSGYTTATGGFTPTYRVALSTVKSQSKATEVLVGDTVVYSYYTYPVGYVDSSYVYLGARVSIRGSTGVAGTTPVKGTDYWTEADKAEIKSYVDDAILGGAW